MDVDERRRQILILRAEQAELRRRIGAAEDALEYEELLVSILLISLRLRNLEGADDEQRAS